MPDEALKGPQISEQRNPLPCKVGDKGTYTRHDEQFDAEVIKVYSTGLVDLRYGEQRGEPMDAIDIPVKLTDDPTTQKRYFRPSVAAPKSPEPSADKGKDTPPPPEAA